MTAKKRNTAWRNYGDSIRLEGTSTQLKELPVAVYRLDFDNRGFFLAPVSKEFYFDFKIYGTEDRLINRCKVAYEKFKGNLGVALLGKKGSGKTVTAKRISNSLELPTIIIAHPFDGMADYIQSVQQPVTWFFDEFEKVWERRSEKLLSVMDGAMNSSVKQVFLLTANELSFDSNFQERPSRIRYFKVYGDLPVELIREIVTDKLIDQTKLEDVVRFLGQMNTISMDVVNEVVHEVNEFDELPEAFLDMFNVKKVDPKFDLFRLDPNGQKRLVRSYCRLTHSTVKPPFDPERHTSQWLQIDNRNFGHVREVLTDSIVRVHVYDASIDTLDPLPANTRIDSDEEYDGPEPVIRDYEVLPVETFNRHFERSHMVGYSARPRLPWREDEVTE